MRCRYSAVYFLQNPHQRHPIAPPYGRAIGCFCDFQIWFLFSSCHGIVVCNSMIYSPALCVMTALNCIWIQSIHLLTLFSQWQHSFRIKVMLPLAKIHYCAFTPLLLLTYHSNNFDKFSSENNFVYAHLYSGCDSSFTTHFTNRDWFKSRHG